MCQTSVLLEKSGEEELLLENVTSLEVLEGYLKISTLFEGPREFAGVAISRIDFSGGKVFLKEVS
jgi:predicted RNA-binding protein